MISKKPRKKSRYLEQSTLHERALFQMRLEKALLILSILGILFLILLSQTATPTYTGKITSIQSSNNKIIIKIENSSIELILFDTSYINLSKGDTIEFQGRQDTYNNKKQIKIDRITLAK